MLTCTNYKWQKHIWLLSYSLCFFQYFFLSRELAHACVPPLWDSRYDVKPETAMWAIKLASFCSFCKMPKTESSIIKRKWFSYSFGGSRAGHWHSSVEDPPGSIKRQKASGRRTHSKGSPTVTQGQTCCLQQPVARTSQIPQQPP